MNAFIIIIIIIVILKFHPHISPSPSPSPSCAVKCPHLSIRKRENEDDPFPLLPRIRVSPPLPDLLLLLLLLIHGRFCLAPPLLFLPMAAQALKNYAPASPKPNASSISCSICFEPVSEDAGDRSIAKLKCGHFFHLDCIGSAFNAKGRMQCPNCRHVEQGQWLYASGCFLPEDFVEDLTIDEDATYIGATNLQFSHTPWCPHQGSYFSFIFEGSDSPSHSYIEPMVNMRVGSRISAVGAPICPYLAAQGLSIGVPSPQVEGSHVGHHHSSRFSRRRAGVYHSTSQRNFGSSQTSATSSSMPMPYEGISRSISTSSFSRSNSNPQHNLGFLVPNPQSLHAGVNQVSNRSNGGLMFGQLSIHVRNAYPMSTAPNSSYIGNGWIGQNEMNVASHRSHQVPSPNGGWTNEQVHSFSPIVGSTQMSNPVVVPNGIYASQPSSSQWWGWVPHANQRVIATGMPNAYQAERQNFNAGLFPRPRPDSSNRIY